MELIDVRWNLIPVFLAILILMAGCVTPQPPQNNTTVTTPVLGPANGSVPGNVQVQPQEGVTYVKMNDTVSVDYTLRVDGKVVDTNNPILANESGIYNPMRVYEPLTFKVSFDSGMIPGFVANLLAMEVNDTKRFTVAPEDGYGLIDPNKFITVPRYYTKDLYETVPRASLEKNGVTINKTGAGYKTPYGTVIVTNYTDENVTLFYMLTPGTNFTVSGIPQGVVEVSNYTATIEFLLEQNKTYLLPHPETGERQYFLVSDKNDQNITLDGNHPLANKTLDFDVKLLKIERP